MTLLQSPSDATFVPKDQLLAASARIASVMGARYAPFVPHVLPHLLSIAREKADVSVTDGIEADLSSTSSGPQHDSVTGTEHLTVSLPGIGVKRLTLHTTQIQNKALACRAIYEHAASMGPSFAPYSTTCISALIPLVSFKYSAEVRTTAAQALGPVFESLCEATGENSGGGGATITSVAPGAAFEPIVVAMARQLRSEEEDDPETCAALADALSVVCCAAYGSAGGEGGGRAVLTVGRAGSLVEDLVRSVESCLKHRAGVISRLSSGGGGGEGVDEDRRAEYEQILVEGADFLTGLTDSIGYTLKSLRGDFVSIFDRWIHPTFGRLFTEDCRDDRARLAAICLFDDCVEHCGSAAAAKYGPVLLDGIVRVMNDPNPTPDHEDGIELREASVYGIAQLARHAPGGTLSSAFPQLLRCLLAIAEEGRRKGKDDIHNLRLVENSSSALATLCLFTGSPFKSVGGFDRKDAMDVFLANLPLLEDDDEAKVS